jgi:hypothetical protein
VVLPSLAVAESPGFAAASVGEDTGVAVSVSAAVRENPLSEAAAIPPPAAAPLAFAFAGGCAGVSVVGVLVLAPTNGGVLVLVPAAEVAAGGGV